MKNLIFPLFAALLFAACQNSTPTPAQPQPQLDPNKPLTQVDVLQSIAKSKTLLEDVNGFITDLNALPEATKTSNKDMVETLQKYAAEVQEKETANIPKLESAAAEGNNLTNQDEVRAMIMATEEYARHMDGFRSRISQLQNGERR